VSPQLWQACLRHHQGQGFCTDNRSIRQDTAHNETGRHGRHHCQVECVRLHNALRSPGCCGGCSHSCGQIPLVLFLHGSPLSLVCQSLCTTLSQSTATSAATSPVETWTLRRDCCRFITAERFLATQYCILNLAMSVFQTLRLKTIFSFANRFSVVKQLGLKRPAATRSAWCCCSLPGKHGTLTPTQVQA